MKIISIHQPNYIPWLGYFYKISQSDCFIFLDDAQYSNEGMHNYHYIKTPQGPIRLKVPVQQTLGDKINEVRTKDELDWKNKHLRLIESNYIQAKFFKEVFNDLQSLYSPDYKSIAKMNSSIIIFICKKLGLKTEFLESSSLNIYSSKEEKIIDICQALNANVYLSGTGARAYQNEENFIRRGIQLNYLEYKPFVYPQLWNGFYANVSVVDYLMNCGYEWKNVIEKKQRDQN